MKSWHVGVKLDLGEGTRVECVLIVKSADAHDAVAAALSSVISGAKITRVTEA